MSTLYIIVTTLALACCFLLALWNLWVFRIRPERAARAARALPKLSVLVPARNEEHTIRACVESLLAQDYPDLDILVLDDDSTDGTGEILRELSAATGGRLRVLAGAPLEEGWVGKCWACHQLAAEASGTWLLFADADTVHKPGGLRRALALAEARRADLLTLIPEETMDTFGEKLVLPLLHFTTFVFMPLYAIEHARSALFSIGIGQYMLFRREAYRAIGGHRSVKDNIVEDLELAREVKRAGFRLVMADGFPVVSCRMYRNFKDVWNGFSKNIFAGFGYSLVLMLPFLAGYAALFAAPFALLGAALFSDALGAREVTLVCAQAAMIILLRFILAARFRLGALASLLHPLGVLAIIAIAVNSWRWVAFGGGSRWKGRSYHPSPPKSMTEMLRGKRS